MSERPDLVDTFERIYVEWFKRVGAEPGEFFRRTLSEDWVYIDFNGVTRYKADYEPYIAPVPRNRAPKAPRDVRVRIYGDVAIVDGSYQVPGAEGDRGLELKFTAVWILRGGQWQALSHHTSPVTG